jgi:hypothetical protein
MRSGTRQRNLPDLTNINPVRRVADVNSQIPDVDGHGISARLWADGDCLGAIMTEQSPLSSAGTDIPDHEPGAPPLFAPYSPPAVEWGALPATARALRQRLPSC